MMGDLKFQLQHYLAEMWKRRWSILLVTWIVGVAGSLFAATAKDVYTSKATVFVDTTSLMQKIVGKDFNIVDPGVVIENVRKSMYARPNIEEVIRRTDLDLTLNDKRDWESLVETLSQEMSLKRQGRDFYNIEFSSGDPTEARNVVQALLDLFLEEGLVRSGVDSSDSESVIPPPNGTKLPVPQGPTLEEQQYQSFQTQAGAIQGEVQQLLQRLTPQHPDVAAAIIDRSSKRSRVKSTVPIRPLPTCAFRSISARAA